MKNISLEELLEAGCHFGHQVARQNPKAREFIFEARDNIHIIDLEKTKEGLEEAAAFIKEIAQKDGTLLVLGTKRQAEGILKEEMKRVKEQGGTGLYFVTKRWIGGTLTNFTEVAKNYKKLKEITERLQNDYEKAKYTKKEIGDWEKERQKLNGFYGGISEMTKAPDALFIIDTHLEHVASHEARKMGVPTVGITDTNADPTIIDYPIPANDDAVGSLKLIIGYIFDAWVEGKKNVGKETKETKNAAEAEETKVKDQKETPAAKVTPAKDVKQEGNEKAVEKKETKATNKPAEASPKKEVKTTEKKSVVKKTTSKKE
jgi:small subunit ribosomal protein S2